MGSSEMIFFCDNTKSVVSSGELVHAGVEINLIDVGCNHKTYCYDL
jgi:hypothetical protein